MQSRYPKKRKNLRTVHKIRKTNDLPSLQQKILMNERQTKELIGRNKYSIIQVNKENKKRGKIVFI